METQETAAPLVIVEISPDWTTEIATLDNESLTQSEAIRAIRAVDQETYNEAVEMGRTIATFIERVENLFERYIAPLREPLAVFYEARKSVLDLAKADKKHLALEVGRYQDDQERMRLETQRLLAAEQKRLEEEAQLNAAIEAESSGLSETSLEQILATASSAAAPMAQQTYTKAQGVSGRKTWIAVPKNDDLQAAKLALCVAIAGGRHDLLPYLEENQSALNKRASAETTMFSVPGWEAKYKSAASFRKAG